MHGLGNDFVILDARSTPLAITPALASRIADRRLGIGCDQLVVVMPSDVADLRLNFWNADGGPAEACGNATRCVVALTGAERIETDGGVLTGKAVGAEVEVALGEPRFGWQAIPLAYAMDTAALPLAWDELAAPTAVNVGNPHLVFFVDAPMADARLGVLGPLIEHDPVFPERININVACVTADGAIELRTWERGTGLTDACGTGACATAVAAIRKKIVSSPVEVRMKGGSLTIGWMAGSPIIMRGAATHVFSGQVELDDLA